MARWHSGTYCGPSFSKWSWASENASVGNSGRLTAVCSFIAACEVNLIFSSWDNWSGPWVKLLSLNMETWDIGPRIWILGSCWNKSANRQRKMKKDGILRYPSWGYGEHNIKDGNVISYSVRYQMIPPLLLSPESEREVQAGILNFSFGVTRWKSEENIYVVSTNLSQVWEENCFGGALVMHRLENWVGIFGLQLHRHIVVKTSDNALRRFQIQSIPLAFQSRQSDLELEQESLHCKVNSNDAADCLGYPTWNDFRDFQQHGHYCHRNDVRTLWTSQSMRPSNAKIFGKINCSIDDIHG